MIDPKKPQKYRDIIDELVRMCREGQGQIDPKKVREGVWSKSVTAEDVGSRADLHAINLLLKRLTPEDRETIAKMLEGQVRTGVFETLKALEIYEISPFEDGYESSPYNDFIGRFYDWEWPEQE